MIGQFLSNTNESATVSILQNFLELNKALSEPCRAGKLVGAGRYAARGQRLALDWKVEVTTFFFPLGAGRCVLMVGKGGPNFLPFDPIDGRHTPGLFVTIPIDRCDDTV